MKPDHIIAPPGTRMDNRQNLSIGERLLSLAAGGALGVAASRQKGAASAVLGVAGAALLARGATGSAPIRRLIGPGPDDRKVAKANGWKQASVISRAVTIGASRDKVYRTYRKFENLPEFMVNVISVTETGDRLHWVTESPSGKVAWDAVIVEDKPGEVLAFNAAKGVPVPINTRIEFRDAPGGRGTEVHATVAYPPPGGRPGIAYGKLTQREPGIQLRRDLKRLKMFIETGEVATNKPQSTMLGSYTKA